MRIDLAEHSDLVRGTVEMEETSEGVRCSRFPGDMIETFQADGAPYAESALSTSGIRIALVTDSNLIRLRFARGRTFSENGASVDILVDRAECHSFRSDEDAEDFIVNLELDAVEGDEGHEVEIYFPYLSEVLIRDFELSDGSLFRPSYAGDDRILFLGDAVTQGVGASSPFRTFPALISAELRTDFLNWGLDGSNCSAKLASLALSQEWQTAILSYGLHDYCNSVPLDTFADELENTLRHLSDRGGVRLFVTTMWNLPEYENTPNELGLLPEDYRRTAIQITRQFPEAALLDGSTACGKSKKAFTDDRTLPSDRGMACIAENMLRKLSAGI